jgi:hypothetical protein
VAFHQDIQAYFSRHLRQRLELLVGRRVHDEQDAVGAPGTRFVDLVRIDDEILPEDGQPAGAARRAQVFGRARRRTRGP